METVAAKTILSARNQNSGWFGIDYNMNLYRGCCHGCIYCDSRSSCYGIDSFDRVRAKENALPLLRDELRRKTATGVVGMGAMSDPYNPFEEREQLTRHALELLYAYGFGAALATKSDLVTRDIDVLSDIQREAPVLVKVTVTAADDEMSAAVEPHAPVSSRRFRAIRRLAEAGIYTGILLMPVLPFLEDTDDNIRAIVEQAAQAGARFIYPAFGVTLRDNQRDWYYTRLDERFPGMKERYVRQYGSRYSCTSPRAKKLWELFAQLCGRYGLLYRMQDIVRGYKQGYACQQLRLF